MKKLMVNPAMLGVIYPEVDKNDVRSVELAYVSP